MLVIPTLKFFFCSEIWELPIQYLEARGRGTTAAHHPSSHKVGAQQIPQPKEFRGFMSANTATKLAAFCLTVGGF